MPEQTIILKKPVLIDGERVRELAYDIEKISTDQFIEAETRAAAKSLKGGTITASIAELDSGFHVYLGIMAVLAANPGWSVEDVERVKGSDITELMKVGRNFMTSGSEEDDDGDSPEPEETNEPEETDDEEEPCPPELA